MSTSFNVLKYRLIMFLFFFYFNRTKIMFRRFARQNGTFSILDQIATKVWDKTREIRMSAIIRGEVGDNQHANTLWHCIDKTLKIKKTPWITHVYCRDSIIFCANLRSNMKKIDDLLLYIFYWFWYCYIQIC